MNGKHDENVSKSCKLVLHFSVFLSVDAKVSSTTKTKQNKTKPRSIKKIKCVRRQIIVNFLYTRTVQYIFKPKFVDIFNEKFFA